MTQIPRPLAVTKATVTLSRKAYEALLEALDDAEDRAAVKSSIAREKQGLNDALPAKLYRRILAGDHPVHIWRQHRGLGLNALAREAKLSASYLSEIEKRIKPGSVSAMRCLAKALRVSLDDLVS
jgi:ribosome-binding protein aMBF1 (putative translation factor)